MGDFAKLGEEKANSEVALHAKAGSEEPAEIEESSRADGPGVGVIFGDICDGGSGGVGLIRVESGDVEFLPDAGRSEACKGGGNESFALVVGAFEADVDPVEFKFPFGLNLVGYDILCDEGLVEPARELEDACSGGDCGSGFGAGVCGLANAGSFGVEYPVVCSEVGSDAHFEALRVLSFLKEGKSSRFRGLDGTGVSSGDKSCCCEIESLFANAPVEIRSGEIHIAVYDLSVSGMPVGCRSL